MSENTSAPIDAAQAAPSRRGKGGMIIALGLVVAALGAGAYFWLSRPSLPPRQLVEASAPYTPDLRRPDALIESVSLSRLPKDLLSVPLLADTLSEDFVFYYENNADRLGLRGSLRRIIYEHDLTLQDSLIDALFDQPADIALWRGADGKLKNFIMVIERGGLAKILEPLAHVALNDTQLRPAGELRVDGDSVAVYRLRYNTYQDILFASYGDKLVVLSNPAMLLDGEARQLRPNTEALEALLSGKNFLPDYFGLPQRGDLAHRISLDANAIAFGYQRFIPAFAGVRFEMDEKGWASHLALNRVDGQAESDLRPVWQAMPMGASVCVALPVTLELPDSVLKTLTQDTTATAELAKSISSAGLCWYDTSRLHSPLFVAKLKTAGTPATDELLGRLFERAIGSNEPRAAQQIFPLQAETQGAATVWRRQVSSPYGTYPAKQASQPDQITGPNFFRVSMARDNAMLLFSLDDRLVGAALNTLEKRFPPMADIVPEQGLVPAYIAPRTLSSLLQNETWQSLPQNVEPVFRNAAQTLLLPKLQALAKHDSYVLTAPAGGKADKAWQWLPLTWRPL